MSKDGDGGTRVYVGGLNDSVKKEDLELEFEKFGKLNSVWVAFNPPGFAFIEFSNQVDAETACDNLNGTDLLGSKLRVEIARGKRRGGFRGGRGGGGSRGGSSGGWRRGSSFGSSGGGDRGYRGNSRGSRGPPRYDSYGSSSSGGSRRGRDYSSRDSYGSGGRSSYGGGSRGGSRGSGGGGSRYRSRSPVQRQSY